MKAFDRGQKNQKTSGGFTLVELMIVIVIMVILAAAAVPLFGGYAQRAKDSKSIAECRQVVQAAQVKANDLYAAGLLKVTQTNNTISEHNEEIKKLANVNGKVEQGPTVDESAQVVFVLYECENGVRVRYDVTKNPKYVVETAEAPLTVLKDWTQKADKWLADIITSKPTAQSIDRKDVINAAEENGGLLKVAGDLTQGTSYENQSLYWRPYYIGNFKENPQTVLYADIGHTGHGTWSAKMVYVDGEVYISPKKGGIGIAEWGQNGENTPKDYNELKKWLTDKGFTKKE